MLRGVVGSTVHGLSNPGTDDRDEMGVCLEPPQYVVGLRPFEHRVFRTQPEGHPSGPGDLDLTIYGSRKFCRRPARLEQLILDSDLPDESDRDRIDGFLVAAYRRAWTASAPAESR